MSEKKKPKEKKKLKRKKRNEFLHFDFDLLKMAKQMYSLISVLAVTSVLQMSINFLEKIQSVTEEFDQHELYVVHF